MCRAAPERTAASRPRAPVSSAAPAAAASESETRPVTVAIAMFSMKTQKTSHNSFVDTHTHTIASLMFSLNTQFSRIPGPRRAASRSESAGQLGGACRRAPVGVRLESRVPGRVGPTRRASTARAADFFESRGRAGAPPRRIRCEEPRPSGRVPCCAAPSGRAGRRRMLSSSCRGLAAARTPRRIRHGGAENTPGRATAARGRIRASGSAADAFAPARGREEKKIWVTDVPSPASDFDVEHAPMMADSDAPPAARASRVKFCQCSDKCDAS